MNSLKANSNLLDEITKIPGQSIVWYIQGSFEDPVLQEGVSMESLTLLRSNDYIFIPESLTSKQSWEWAKEVFNYHDDQVIWYTHFRRGEESVEYHLNNFKIFEGKNVIFVSLMVNKMMLEAAELLNINFYGNCFTNTPDKRWIHSTIPGSQFSSNVYNLDLPKVNAPKGYTCYNKEELRIAKDLLVKEGVREFVIKNVNGISGFGIYLCKSESEFEEILSSIEFKNGLIEVAVYETKPAFIIEEKMELFSEIESEKITFTPVVYFIGDKTLRICRQLVKDNCFVGTRSKPFDKITQKNINAQIEILISKIPKFNNGPWGVDFFHDREGNVYVTDPNLGRFNSGTFVCIFMSIYAQGKSFMTNKIGVEDWRSLYETIKQNDLTFNFETKKGITFLIPTRSILFSTLLIVGENEEEVELLYEKYTKIKEKFLNI